MAVSTFPIYDRLLGGTLTDLLSGWRDEGMSLEAMARKLHADYQIDVTGETVRRWCSEAGIPTGRLDGAA